MMEQMELYQVLDFADGFIINEDVIIRTLRVMQKQMLGLVELLNMEIVNIILSGENFILGIKQCEIYEAELVQVDGMYQAIQNGQLSKIILLELLVGYELDGNAMDLDGNITILKQL